MRKTLALLTAAAIVAGFATDAMAGKARKHNSQASQDRMTTGQARPGSYTGGNAALQGNNGNSGQGSNSLGHIKGGNIGAGK